MEGTPIAEREPSMTPPARVRARLLAAALAFSLLPALAFADAPAPPIHPWKEALARRLARGGMERRPGLPGRGLAGLGDLLRRRRDLDRSGQLPAPGRVGVHVDERPRARGEREDRGVLLLGAVRFSERAVADPRRRGRHQGALERHRDG